MKKITKFFTILALASLTCWTNGCAFGMKQIRQSEAALEFAKTTASKIDLAQVMGKINLPKTEIQAIGPLHLYDSKVASFSNDLVLWNFVQSLKRKDGIECHLTLSFELDISVPAGFSPTPYSQLYCYPDEKNWVKAPVF